MKKSVQINFLKEAARKRDIEICLTMESVLRDSNISAMMFL